jgi:glucose-1-phosphate thymidylyltransferase
MDRLKCALVDGCRRSCLTAIADRPLIAHVLDELDSWGIEQTVILAPASERDALERALGPRSAVSYLEESADGQDAALASALRRTVSEDPLLVHPGDCLFPAQLSCLAEHFGGGRDDVAVLSADGRAAALLGPGAWSRLGTLAPGELSTREALVSLGACAEECKAREHWCYNDSTEQLLIVNRMILDLLPASLPSSESIESSRIDGRVSISPTARISGSTVRGPALVGDGAIVEDSFVGPYTSIGAGAMVSGAELDYSMVLAGAEIRYPGYRVEASVIEELASVSRSFALPKGLHVRLGPGSRVVLG